jgi:hypothetical protein
MLTQTRRRTGVTPLLLAVAVLIAVALPVPATAGAAEQLATESVVEEIAGALGFESSHSPGFWEALAKARADERAAIEAKAAAEHAAAEQQRVEQNNKVIMDALKNGRRIEETGLWEGKMIAFTEIIPPASGDIGNETTFVRTGTEEVAGDGTIRVVTRYLDPHTLGKFGTVVSVIEDGVETVTDVTEDRPGSIDVKVGDTREVPPPGSSAAGKKPHTIDPKADGSRGRASGNHPDAPAEIAQTDATPVKETVVRDKADGGTGGGGDGRRLQFEPIPLPDGRVFTPFLEDKPPRSLEDLPHRSGYTIEHPDWDGAVAQITIYFDKDGKVAGVVAEVIKDGIATIVSVEELIPGSLGGLKKGDTRPARDNPGKVASTWDPKPKTDGSSGPGGGDSAPSNDGSTPSNGGRAPSNGGTQTNGGSSQNDSGPSDPGRAKPESSPDGGNTGKNPGGTTPSGNTGESTGGTTSQTNATSSGDSHPEYEFLRVGPKHENDDGSTSQSTVHRRNEDGVLVQTTTTTQRDGTTSQKKTCYKDSEVVDCGAGMADEPTCRSDCGRLEMLAELFACTSGGGGGAECGRPPEGMRPDPFEDPACAERRTTDGPERPPANVPRAKKEGASSPTCSSEDRPGSPIDYGDPTDPNGPEPPDEGQIVHLLDDGVTDPVNPGEPEEVLDGGTRLDTYGTLRDPANPPGTEDADRNPGGGPPSTGEAERNPLP